MSKILLNLSEFPLNEDVNSDLVNAKKAVNDQLQAIRNEIQNEKEQTEVSQKTASLKKQATLYSALPAMLNKLAASMEAKEKSGDKTNIY
ncbi:hypothetical protein EBS02_11490 [bacterium]|nr:hypothetical protein [bacterium]